MKDGAPEKLRTLYEAVAEIAVLTVPETDCDEGVTIGVAADDTLRLKLKASWAPPEQVAMMMYSLLATVLPFVVPPKVTVPPLEDSVRPETVFPETATSWYPFPDVFGVTLLSAKVGDKQVPDTVPLVVYPAVLMTAKMSSIFVFSVEQF